MAAKKTAKKTSAKKDAGAKAPSKSELFANLADKTGLSKKQVSQVFASLTEIVAKNLSGRGPGVFVMPGLAKMKVVKKPATKARKGVNPFTGLAMTFKAKPARKVVKVQALKALKDMV